jgi:hypothetical protein
VASALSLTDGAVRGMVYRARAAMRAAATGLTPPSVAIWAASAGAGTGGGVPLAPRIGEAMAPGGAGVAGLLLKGGAVAVTAGGLVTGAVLVPHHHWTPAIQESGAGDASNANGRASGANEGAGGGTRGGPAWDGATSGGAAGGADRLVRFAHGGGWRRQGGLGLLGAGVLERGARGGGGGRRHGGDSAGSEHHRAPGSATSDGARQGGGHGGSGGGGSGASGPGRGPGDGTGSGAGTPHEGGSGGKGSPESDGGSGSGSGSPSGGGPGPSGGSGSGPAPTRVPNNLIPGSGGGGGSPPGSGGGGDAATPAPSGSSGTTAPHD